MSQQRISTIVGIFLLAVLLVPLWPLKVFAASLSVTPASSSVSVGNIVSVKAFVNTEGRAINNADAIIQFPTDLLEVVSVSKSQSIFTIWVEEPKFSNFSGQVTFNGGLPSPGYTGSSGEIVSVVFKAKKQGVASLVIGESAVRQNDGLGTDILTSKQNSVIQIGAAVPTETPIVVPVSNLPQKPVVTSSTHPDQNSWYKGDSASFGWTVPEGVTSIQTLLSRIATAVPTITYDNSVTSRTVTGLTDGILYFHLRYMNNNGWGPTEHYKIQLDSTPPEPFNAQITARNSRDVITLNASDSTSGIDSYGISIDGGSPIKVKRSALTNNEFELPVQNKGIHSVTVVAYDKAGNSTESRISYTSSPILAPEIKVQPVHVEMGETVTVTGTTPYRDSSVTVYVEAGRGKVGKYETKTDNAGTFTLVIPSLKTSGEVRIYAELVFSESVKSPSSEKATVIVNDSYAVRTSKSLVYTLLYVIPAVALLLGLFFMLYLGWHRFFGLRRKISKELDGVVEDAHKALTMFKEELSNQLEKLEKLKSDRELNKKEEKIFKELQKNVDSIDTLIEKKIKRLR